MGDPGPATARSGGRPERRWQRLARRLSGPQQLTAPAQITAVFLLCLSGLALVLVGETVALPGVTLGSYALLAVLVGTWVLPTALAGAVVVTALGVLLAAVADGAVDGVTGGFQLTATAIVATASRLTVSALRRSESRRSQLHQRLLDSERQRADEAATRLMEKERLAQELREALTAVRIQADQLLRLNERLVEFTADAAHELRAPLAVMRSVVDRALDRPRDASDYRDSLAAVRREVVRLSGMAETLLLLARADEDQLVVLRSPVDVADFLGDVAARWQAMAEERGLTLELELPEGGTLQADPLLLGRVLDNLLDNACRHASTGGWVALSGRRCSSGWLLIVSNSGPAIPAELRGEIFERFRRGDTARTPGAGGAGLGLALCRAITRLHGGDVHLDEGPDTRFVVELP